MIRNAKNRYRIYGYLFFILALMAIILKLGVINWARVGHVQLINNFLISDIENEILLVKNANELSENYLMILEIPKINFKQGLYQIDDHRNKVNQNPQILKESDLPNVQGGLLIIAAHSGWGRYAYFNKLHLLNEKNQIYIYYQNQKYTYKIKDVIRQDKIGSINITHGEASELILTTCDPQYKGQQLIIQAELIAIL